MQINSKKSTVEQEIRTEFGKKFWIMMAVFYALFVVRNVLSVEFPVFLYLIWIATMALVFNDTETKALLISFIPLMPGFQGKYAILVCMIFLLIKYGKQLKIPIFAFIVPILMLWEFLHLEDSFSSIAEYLSGFAPLMCLVIIVSLPYKEEDISFFTRTLAISLVVASLILISNTVMGSNQSLMSLIQEGFRLGAVEEAETYEIVYNANGLGYLCNIAIAGLLTNVYFNKAKKIDYFMLMFLAVIGCLTVSRTFLLCFAGTMVLFILLQEKSFSHKLKTFAAIFASIFLFIVVLKIALPNIIENYVVRFNADDITGGRAGLYDFYNEFITSSSERLLYGIGVQSISEKVRYLVGSVVNVPHNGYQQIVIAWGLVGLILMMTFIFCLVLHAWKKNPKASFMCYLPLILLLTNIMAGQFVTSGNKLLSLTFIYLMICNGGKGMAKNSNGSKECK